MTIHIGLIGGGNITETHARAVRAIPGVEIAAIYGENSGKVAALGGQYGGRAYHDLESFLKHRPMDFVIIGGPSGLHVAHGLAVARYGLHILIEKPLDISTRRADELISAAERAGVKLGVMFQDRVKPGIRQLKQWVSQGLLGKLLLVDARVKWYRPPEYYSDSRWRGTLALDGGGPVINQAVHTLDLILWLVGDVVRVQASKATAFHTIEGEDTAVALLEFAAGALGVLQATTAVYPGYPRRLEITGSEGTVILEHDRILSCDLRTVPNGFTQDFPTDGNQSPSSAVVSDARGHQVLIEDFIGAIKMDRPPICDEREGRRSLALVEAIYRAAEMRPELLVRSSLGKT